MKKPIICHVIGMKHINEMNDNSRHIFYKSYGEHIFCHIDDKPPKADIYFLECFIKDWEKFYNFKKPYSSSKIISFIHSSSTCKPSKYSDKIVVLTETWKEKLKKDGHESIVINNGIDLSLYKYGIDYSNKNFGRITRYSNKKVHPKFKKIALQVLKKIKDSKCLIFCDNFPTTTHKRFIIDDSIKIHEHEKKAQKLAQLSLYTDMHYTFIEVFPMGLLEAMAAGLCCLMYSHRKQPSMKEVLGAAGIWCKTVKGYQKKLVELLNDSEQKKEYGLKAKERARFFTIEKMIEKYNILFKEVLNG
jgi:glycosyltransferase involved in cell wall biosynthesis